jgi:hypothetical protein
MYCVFLGRAVATNAPGAGSVGTSQLAADAITEAKIADGAVESEHLNDNVISGQTELAVAPASTDELLISDGGTIKRIDVSLIGGTNTPAFLVQGPSGGQSLSNGVWTKITDWNNVYDTASGFDFTNDKYTIASGQGGKYFVYGFIKFAGSASRRIQIAVYKNGSSVQGQSNNVDYYAGVYIGVALEFAASDYIEIYGKIDNGGGGTVMTDNTAERFGAFKLVE